jgi:hypothetical protein
MTRIETRPKAGKRYGFVAPAMRIPAITPTTTPEAPTAGLRIAAFAGAHASKISRSGNDR